MHSPLSAPSACSADPLAAQTDDLARLEAEGRRRCLIPRAGLDFASNDYLGLAASGVLEAAARAALDRGVPVGSGGSRLLRGNCSEHEKLEAEAAAFFGSESALFLSSGFVANSALFSTLPQHGDLVLADELVHASCHEGLKLTRAQSRLVPHGDMQAFENALSQWRGAGNSGQVWLAVEALYSMDGDRGPVAQLGELAQRYGAILLVDEAHSTGIFGPGGRGLVAEAGLQGRSNVISLHTCGKGLGCEGALLCGPAAMKDFLINRARGFIFSTAPSPLMAAIVRAALRICEGGDDLRAALQARIAKAGHLLGPMGAELHGSPVLPLVLGDNHRTMRIASRLQAAGFDVRGIRPPTVPQGTSRLRIVITLNTDESDIAALACELEAALAEEG